jgi:phage tail-like protein
VAVADRKDPYLGFNFLVEIDGLTVGGFSEVSGLEVNIDVQAMREGGVNEYMRQIVGGAKHPNIVLKRGLTDDDALWNWQRDVARGKIQRKNGSVVLRDPQGNEKWRWNFQSAYPVKWHGPDFKAGTAEVSIEILEIVHEGLVKG